MFAGTGIVRCTGFECAVCLAREEVGFRQTQAGFFHQRRLFSSLNLVVVSLLEAVQTYVD